MIGGRLERDRIVPGPGASGRTFRVAGVSGGGRRLPAWTVDPD